MSPVRVLYIGGWGRSGSTILGNVLGELPGVAHVGEVVSAWRRGMVEDQPCGCGEPFSACPVWGEAAAVFGADAAAVGEATDRALWAGPMNRALLGLPLGRVPRADPALLATTATLYRALRDATGAEVLVDGSKFPFYAHHLSQVAGVELSVLHLVRDPRASAHSWAKAVVREDTDAPMARHPVARSTRRWVGHNLATELVARRAARRLRLRYEDAVADPAGTLRRVAGWLGLDPGPLAVVDGDAVSLGPHHTVWGNPARQRTGRVVLRRDDAWRTAMPRRDRALAWALAAPLALRYGYR